MEVKGMKLNISVFGLGYVGTVLLGCLAKEGHKVLGVDVDPVKLDLLRNGKAPVLEEGIQALIQSSIESGRVDVTNDTEFAINNTDLSFVCVGTPAMTNGSQDLRAILRLAEEIGKALKNKHGFHTIVIRSTVLPGTVENKIEPVIEQFSEKKSGIDFGLCFQPEFLREASSIKDYYNPPFTIIGGNSQASILILEGLFKELPAEIIITSIPKAEMVKYCCNIFHALKITFANEIGRICQSLGVDSRDVMQIVCKDTQLNISPVYLRPGFAYGGSCLPKDLKGLMYHARMNDVEVPVLSNISTSNAVHIEHAVNMVTETGEKTIGMVGLSFKQGTDDLRESPLVTLAEKFIGKGFDLKIYDPHVNLSRLIGANRTYIEHAIPHIASLMTNEHEKIIEGSRIIIIAQNDRIFIEALYSLCKKDHIILDLTGSVDPSKIKGTYRGICW